MIQPSLYELSKDDDVGEGDGNDALMSKEASQSAVPSSAAGARLFFFWRGFFGGGVSFWRRRLEGYHCQDERLEVQRE